MALNLRRGFLRLWALGSGGWLILTVVLFWDKWREHFNPTPLPEGFTLVPDEFAMFTPFNAKSSPILDGLLFAISAPAASFALGLAFMWIYRGFTKSEDGRAP